jgi:histidine triad (HIT) family protein
MKSECVFCKIASGTLPTDIIAEDEHTLTFLDNNPMFPGHMLVVPRRHSETLTELPDSEIAPLFKQVRRATEALISGLGAEGSFMAINHKISQSVPHLHVHVIPRTKGDGMKGFFWPRRGYHNDEHRGETVTKLRAAFNALAT